MIGGQGVEVSKTLFYSRETLLPGKRKTLRRMRTSAKQKRAAEAAASETEALSESGRKIFLAFSGYKKKNFGNLLE